LYGPNDNYNTLSSHFFPALIKKIYFAKIKKIPTVYLWGDGKPKREVMFVDDFADACLFFIKKKTKESLINVGTGKEKTIIE
jgi:GDP-L-fucose synthase